MHSVPCYADDTTTAPPAVTSSTTGTNATKAALQLHHKGRRALEKRVFGEAKELFLKALAIKPDFLEARIDLGTALYELHDYSEALAELDIAAAMMHTEETREHGHSFRLLRGRALHHTSKFDLAVSELTQAIQIDDKNPDAYLSRASAYDAMGKPDEAIADLTKAISIDPTNAQAYLQRAMLYKHRGQYQESIADLSEAVKLRPDLITWRASVHREHGKTDEALEDYTKAIEIHSGLDKATHHFNRGLIYADLDQHRKAVDDFTQALRISPNVADYFTHRGTAFFALSDFKRAVADIDAALVLEPKNPDLYFRRALAYMQDGDNEIALADLNKAIELSPKPPAVFYMKRAIIKSLMRNHEGAIQDITLAIHVEDSDAEEYFDRGLEYLNTASFEKAKADFDKSISLRPQFPGAYKSRAIARNQLGDETGALQDLVKSNELYAHDGDSHGTLEVGRLMLRFKKR